MYVNSGLAPAKADLKGISFALTETLDHVTIPMDLSAASEHVGEVSYI